MGPRSRSPSPRRYDDDRRRSYQDDRERYRDSRDRHHDDPRSSSRREDDHYQGRHDGDRRLSRGEGSARNHRHSSGRSSRHRDGTPDDDEPLLDLRKLGVSKIKEDDYFLKSVEFKYWLKDSRGRYLDELSSDSAHRYFRKFVRRWNDGALREKFYFPPDPESGGSQTGYKWSFASKDHTSRDRPSHPDEDLEWQEKAIPPASSAGKMGPELESSDEEIGPSLPSVPVSQLPPVTTADLQLAKEEAADRRRLERKAERREAYNRADEMAPRGVGKEGKMQEKRAANEENKKYREKDATEGFEADEGTLMGDSGSFAAADGAAAKRQERKEASMADRAALDRERLMERKAKDSQTMDMFKALAKQRFG